MKKTSSLEHTVVICFFATVVALIWFSFAYSNNATAVKFVSDLWAWQTLIGAIIAATLALLAAGWTVNGIREQIEVSKNLAEAENDLVLDQALRKFGATKLLLPHALATVNVYSEECLEYIDQLVELVEQKATGSSYVQLPSTILTGDAPSLKKIDLTTFSKLAQLAPLTSNLPKYLAVFSCALQIQNSRLSSLETELAKKEFRINDHEVTTLLGNIYDIKNVAANLYEFARNQTTEVIVSEEFLENCYMPDALRILAIPRLGELMISYKGGIFTKFWKKDS
ncbi:hypothetical protein [Maritalea sp.]|uniref:hypothetical protein n=1 Tax=Maritalea sp. TaxID=2003361 RepID=UPI003EF91851